MKHSLRLKMTLILVMSLTAMIALCWVINRSFLADYYQNRKVTMLSETYYSVNSLIGDELTELDDNVTNGIERIEASYNVSVYIISSETAMPGMSGMSFIYPIEMEVGKGGGFGLFRNEKYSRITQSLQKYIFGDISGRKDETSPQLLKTESDCYDVYKSF